MCSTMFSRIKKYHIHIIFFIIFAYVAFLLLYKLGLQSFWIDEGFSSYVSKYMSLNGLYRSSYFLFEWLQVLCFKLGGISDFRARLPSVITHLLSLLLMYLIPYRLTKNKYVGLFSLFIFGFLYWEIGWGRDARFYSLLQLMFLTGIDFFIKWIESKKVLYLNLSIILTGLGIIFHPFLCCLGAILFFIIVWQYGKTWTFKKLLSKEYLITGILLLIGLFFIIFFGDIRNNFSGSILGDKPIRYVKHYFLSYNSHLRTQLGIIYVLGLIGMIWFLIKKNIRETILLFCPFILFAYALVIKGHLLHYRYALLLYPIIIISASVFVFQIIKLIKNKYILFSSLLVLFILIGVTTKLQFIPISNYYFDYTSPQPDFKSAYRVIPEGSNVISGFPTLCDWYYSNNGICSYAIRVDLVHDGNTEDLMNREEEKRTGIQYITDLSQLNPNTYYFVIDNLTQKSRTINQKLFDQLHRYGRLIFEDGTGYNNIVVLQVNVIS